MLFDLVPSREITGGPWYNEQEFDHVFIEALSKFVYEVVRSAGVATLKELTDRVRASGISKVALHAVQNLRQHLHAHQSHGCSLRHVSRLQPV